MSQTQHTIIWGTGSLCERFWPLLQDKQNVIGFVDPSGNGTKYNLPIFAAEDIKHFQVDCLYICSTWLDDIIPRCRDIGIPDACIKVVLPRSVEVVPFTEFDELSAGKYYFLPWKNQLKEVELSLSSDIVHPDVYKDLAKSVGYCFISSIEGDFAEFGTCSGYTASLIAHSINFYSQRMVRHEQAHSMKARELCLFDSFEGFPEATLPEDLDSPHVASGVWGAGIAKGLNAVQLRALTEQYLAKDRINIYEGWYKDTLTEIPTGQKFAFVHMDCDLYESTIDVLRYLFSHDHLAEGAMLLFDNWYCNRASDKFAERRAWLKLCEEFEVHTSDLGMYACVGHRMIIHDYRKK